MLNDLYRNGHSCSLPICADTDLLLDIFDTQPKRFDDRIYLPPADQLRLNRMLSLEDTRMDGELQRPLPRLEDLDLVRILVRFAGLSADVQDSLANSSVTHSLRLALKS
jgi:hypothetical protein